MKKILFLFAVAMSFNYSAKALDASLSYATFNSPDQPYVEIYMYIYGQSISQKMTPDSLFQSNAEVVILFKQAEQIIKFDKFLLNGPLDKKALDVYDMKRYGLANGTYDLEITVKDANALPDQLNQKNYKTSITIDYQGEGLMQSDIELLGSIKADDSQMAAVKNGYYMEALPFNFYHKRMSTLIFYNELYNTDKAIKDDFLVRYFIEKVNGNGTTEAMIIANKKRKPAAINPLLFQMDISKLPSGNYQLVIEIRNREGELLIDKKTDFQRSNPYLDLEKARTAPIDDEFVSKLTKQELRYSLKAIAPLVKNADVEVLNIILEDKENLEPQRRFLFTFWAIESPINTEETYKGYMEVARWVDEYYKSGFGYGFETDRGHIFLEYGKPNDVVRVDTDPTAPPYEIWVYEDFPKTNQNRVKFIFYNASLAPGDFRMLHSTARSEVNNPQWEVELYKDAPNELSGGDFISGTNMQDNINRQARRLFEDL